ncbi:MAG TPA: NIPSNAP family protein [Verrucomicrobiae bacterium]|nr:NIPSNAP family protein [Verrucomicrobiae bacterium]
MYRRRFLQSAAGASLLPQSAAQAAAQQPDSNPERTRFYSFAYYSYRQGDQAARLHRFLSSQMPLFTKHMRACGVFTAVMAPRTQTTLVIAGFSSFADVQSSAAQIAGDAEYQKAHEELERGADPPYDSLDRTLLAATDFSPEIAPLPEKPRSPRYFEMRIYHSPTSRQQRILHERFSGPEIQVFHRSGIHPILYANTVFGANLSNLTYFMPFATLADREKAWSAFSADPDWIKARDESVARGGQIVDTQSILLWRAAAFSPIQ